MFSSTIIPTVGRPSLARAIESVLSQNFPLDQFEVIVINDSGKPLPEEDWQKCPAVKVFDTNRRERCIARNTGAALAHGDYLHFLDDDDWLLPNALQQIWEVSNRHKNAVWLYGGIQVIGGTGEIMGETNLGKSGNCFAHVLGGGWIPIQSSFIRSDAFFSVNGYDVELLATQDIDLCRRLALLGDFAHTTASVARLFRGTGWHTQTDYDRAPEFNRLGRDKLLAKPGVHCRLMNGGKTAYWSGRVVRIYLTNALWNLKRRKPFVALKRMLSGLFFLVTSGQHMLSSEYWLALRTEHVPGTLHPILQNYRQHQRHLQIIHGV